MLVGAKELRGLVDLLARLVRCWAVWDVMPAEEKSGDGPGYGEQFLNMMVSLFYCVLLDSCVGRRRSDCGFAGGAGAGADVSGYGILGVGFVYWPLSVSWVALGVSSFEPLGRAVSCDVGWLGGCRPYGAAGTDFPVGADYC